MTGFLLFLKFYKHHTILSYLINFQKKKKKSFISTLFLVTYLIKKNKPFKKQISFAKVSL